MFGDVAFVARERIDMPPPGDTRPARFEVDAPATASGTRSTRRSPALVERARRRLNRLQFLTIRHYLTFVFGALVALLVVLASWQ